MQLHYSHIAAPSSPTCGGGPRWGTNDPGLKRTEVGDKRPRTKEQRDGRQTTPYPNKALLKRRLGKQQIAVWQHRDAAQRFGLAD